LECQILKKRRKSKGKTTKDSQNWLMSPIPEGVEPKISIIDISNKP
jgi:hypothetical protein